MIECAHSPFLEASRTLLGELVEGLGRDNDFVSVLATDDSGLSFRASRGETAISDLSARGRSVGVRTRAL